MERKLLERLYQNPWGIHFLTSWFPRNFWCGLHFYCSDNHHLKFAISIMCFKQFDVMNNDRLVEEVAGGASVAQIFKDHNE